MPCVAGRGRDAPLLERQKKVRARGVLSGWAPGERKPWVKASEINPHWDLIIARAGEAVDVNAYALRHTRIVACLRARLPTRLVASMHDTSVGMI
jgi:hypothetical protein